MGSEDKLLRLMGLPQSRSQHIYSQNILLSHGERRHYQKLQGKMYLFTPIMCVYDSEVQSSFSSISQQPCSCIFSESSFLCKFVFSEIHL